MKNIITLLICFLLSSPAIQLQAQSDASNSKVLICVSNSAERYHKSRCNGLNQCNHTISEVTKDEAVKMGRTPCKICYSSSSSSSSGYSSDGSSSSSGGCPTVQCSGTTQKGLRCKNKTTNCGGRCYHHD